MVCTANNFNSRKKQDDTRGPGWWVGAENAHRKNSSLSTETESDQLEAIKFVSQVDSYTKPRQHFIDNKTEKQNLFT